MRQIANASQDPSKSNSSNETKEGAREVRLSEAKQLLEEAWEGLWKTRDSIIEAVRQQRLEESLGRLVELAQLSGDSTGENTWRNKLQELQPKEQ